MIPIQEIKVSDQSIKSTKKLKVKKRISNKLSIAEGGGTSKKNKNNLCENLNQSENHNQNQNED